MTGEEMERAIQFLIEHHAKVSSDIEGLKEAQEKTATHLAILTENIARTEAQAEIDWRETRERLERLADEMRQSFDSVTVEMRDGFNKLILGNEVTRDLAQQVARLAVTTSQRVTVLEEKLP